MSVLLVNNKVPRPIRDAFTRSPPSQIGEEDLWRSIVARAVLDAIGQVSPLGMEERPDSTQLCVREARNWFGHQNYQRACDLGNLDARLIRALVLAEIVRIEKDDLALYRLYRIFPFMERTCDEE